MTLPAKVRRKSNMGRTIIVGSQSLTKIKEYAEAHGGYKAIYRGTEYNYRTVYRIINEGKGKEKIVRKILSFIDKEHERLLDIKLIDNDKM